MKVNFDHIGEVEFDDSLILTFENGLIGFEYLKKFVLIKTDDDLFYWLNSIERPEFCFPLIGIRVIDENYPFMENFEAFAVVVFNKDPLKITINLKAPIYINQDSKIGLQKIIDDDKYPVDYKLFVEC
ncbi:MAG: flagellar assembly protein FliW [Ignavibacterium sp.]|nr:flagellar assembly protein FliW [Ignavibacterium sp.]MCX7610594.1 flagellar assembly protein FliW [Ignavibacterium sp.]MDW8374158.1 flagellar assembly protein FliW [Ignavibacteriales bacterium]